MRRTYLIFLTLSLLGMVACQTAVLPEDVPTETAVFTVEPQIGVSFVTRAVPTTAVLQTTPTPLPTATATPTATPVVYKIASGDTVLGVAIQRGTTVEEILTLNPGIVPENLQIGQSIILPPPATAIALAAQGTRVPLQVAVTKINAYKTPIGSLWLLGEVTNEGSDPVENIQVEIGLLAADGRSLGSATAWVATSIILPGERGPFAVLVDEPPADFAQPVVSVVGGQHLVELGTRYLDVALLDSEIELKSSGAVLSGLVRNDGAEVASNVQIIATFYDEQGNVTGFQQQVVAERLEVGEERPFLLESTPPGGETVNYALYIEARSDLAGATVPLPKQ
ncbi:hypothetical protein MNBD_CHLOROFLEXI01-3003 [hydrothermal vent metagenome]|uniref:LysM domain-containing protein n=1 Tax=hydrothermal vent metagenome TaxID=652676 RepID=A0A3B0V4L2_9ZZZZ